MKTKLIFAILFLLFNTIILSGRNIISVYAGNDTLSTVSTLAILPEVDEETSVNDIPFDTKAITLKSLTPDVEKTLIEVDEENYINDIPFDTKAIALKSLSLNPEKLQADAYMNDIPFDIEKITESSFYKALSVQPEEESYIDDIPFSTSNIVEDYMLNGNRLVSQPDNSKCGE